MARKSTGQRVVWMIIVIVTALSMIGYLALPFLR